MKGLNDSKIHTNGHNPKTECLVLCTLHAEALILYEISTYKP